MLRRMKIKRCPKCKGSRIDLFAGGYTGSYKCLDCDYFGPFIIEEEIDKKKLKK